MKTEKFGTMILEFAFGELENYMNAQNKTMELFRDTAKILIGASGFILGVLGLLLTISPGVKLTWWFLFPFGFYLTSFILSLVVVVGSKWSTPFSTKSYEELMNGLRGVQLDNENYQDLVNQRLSNYLVSRNKNERMIISRNRIIKLAVFFFTIAIISAPIVLLAN